MNKIINKIKDNKWLFIILLIGSFLRFYKLDFQSLWMDEIYTMNISNPKFTFSEFHNEMLLREGFPYLYYILLKLSYVLFGYSSIVARGFSAFFGVVGILVIYLISKLLINKKTGLIAAFLLAVNEYHIYISQDARLYTLYFVATIFCFYRLVLFLKNRTNKNTLWYGLSAGLLISINFFGFINLLSQVFIVLFFLVNSEKKERKDFLLKAIYSGIIAIIVFLPNYDMLLKLLNLKSFWVPKPTNESFSLLIKEFLGNSEITLFIFNFVFVYYIITLFSKKSDYSSKSLFENKSNFAFIIYFGWIFIFIYFLLVKSYGEVSLILTRYFTSILPVILLILATGIGYIKNEFIKAILILSILILSLTNLIIVKDYYNRIGKAQFREASNFVIQNHNGKEPIYTSQKYWFDYYFINDTIKKNINEIEFENLIQSMINDSTKIKNFWYIDAFTKDYKPTESTLSFINNNFYIDNNYDGFQAWTKHFILLKDVTTTVDISKFGTLNQYNGDGFMFNVETFEITNNILSTSGWAYFEKQTAAKTKMEIVLIKDGKANRLMTQKVIRPDVTSYFKNDFNVDNCGFKSTYNIEKLEPGKHQLGIYLIDEETKKEGLILTDKFIDAL